MGNTAKPRGITLFVDLDGTLLMHNYDPENIQEVILKKRLSSIQKIIDNETEKVFVVITTSRSIDHAVIALDALKVFGFEPDHIICNLPAGRRVLINDSPSDEKKAICINLLRDVDSCLNLEP